MNIFQRIFGTKENTEPLAAVEAPPPAVADARVDTYVSLRGQEILAAIEAGIHPSVAGNNFIEMFKTIPEVFWPIDFIAKRISEAHFDLKRDKDDSLVWCNRLNADAILKSPNPVMSFRELVYQHFVYKLATGNGFWRAAMPDTITEDATKFQWCSAYWSIPSTMIDVLPDLRANKVPMFGVATANDLIKGYVLKDGERAYYNIPTWQIWHDRDGIPETRRMAGYMKAPSRLMAVKRPIANLLAVYEARNVIYIKRGALGFIVSQKQDMAGTAALEPEEKEALEKSFAERHGVADGKSPYVITDVPVNFVKTSNSIADLQPFDETLEDTIKIASVYGIPAVLVPRKDQSTFSNQDAAEKSVYTSVIIPMAKRFCDELTRFIGLDKKGLYLDCDFSDVACLQAGLREGEIVKKMVNERCKVEFENGLITINDWRSQIHESALEGEIYSKVKFDMTDEEIAQVEKIMNCR